MCILNSFSLCCYFNLGKQNTKSSFSDVCFQTKFILIQCIAVVLVRPRKFVPFLCCLLLKTTIWKLLRIIVFGVWRSPYHLLKGDQLMCVILKPVFDWADDGRVDGKMLESFKCGSEE